MGSFAATAAEERRLHMAFDQFHHRNEWFYLSRTLQDFIAGTCRVKRATRPVDISMQEADGERVERYIKSRDPVKIIRAGKLYSAYAAWCGSQGLRPINPKRFGITMAQLGIAKDDRNNRVSYLNV